MTDLYKVAEFFPWFGFFIGSCLGSFLNVVTYRVPKGLSVVHPGSSCRSCSVPIPWFLNIPVISWLVLRGRANCCGSRIPPRYFLVELITGLFFAWIFSDYLPHQDVGILLASLAFSWLLIGVVVTDFETMLIPDRFSVGGACLGFFLSVYFPSIHTIENHPHGMEHLLAGFDSLLGILIGSGLLYWIGALASWAFNREALGEGDIKLLGCVGAFCGWQGSVFCIFGGALIGCVWLLLISLWQKIGTAKNLDKNQLAFGIEVPFGPYLAIAAMAYFFGLKIWIDPWFDWINELSF